MFAQRLLRVLIEQRQQGRVVASTTGWSAGVRPG
jgi:hypothetical protein